MFHCLANAALLKRLVGREFCGVEHRAGRYSREADQLHRLMLVVFERPFGNDRVHFLAAGKVNVLGFLVGQ